MALSIILLSNILGYIREFFYLHILTCIYKQPLDYLNIIQIINSITKPGFENLNFLISKTRFISKTILFVDDINDRIIFAVCLWNLLLPKLCK